MPNFYTGLLTDEYRLIRFPVNCRSWSYSLTTAPDLPQVCVTTDGVSKTWAKEVRIEAKTRLQAGKAFALVLQAIELLEGCQVFGSPHAENLIRLLGGGTKRN